MRFVLVTFILFMFLYPPITNAAEGTLSTTKDNENLLSIDNVSVTDNATLVNNFKNEEISAQTPAEMCEQGILTPYNKQYISIISDNDAFFNSYLDRYYTAGNSIRYTSKEKDYYCENVKYLGDNQLKRSNLWWLGKVSLIMSQHVTRWEMGITQEMYTPRIKQAPVPGVADYPYAGYLYLSLGILNRNANTEERIQLNLGVVGPAALAQTAQDAIHVVFGLGGRLPGWETQISNEPIFNLHYQITKKFYIFNTQYISADILPSISASLGNAHIDAGVFARVRLGYNLDTDFGVTKINHSIDSAPPHSDKFSIYAFAGAGGKFVIKNIFISGNTFERGTGLDLQRFTYELEGGVAMAIKGFRISYTVSHRGKEFKNQAGAMNFASIALQIAF